MTQRVSLLGATGSVGRSTADVLAHHPDRFETVAVVGGRDVAALAETAKRLRARFAALAEAEAGAALKEVLAGTGIESGAGPSAVMEAAQREADLVVSAISGAAGLPPTHAAIRLGRRVALANKEALVCAGESFMRDARRYGAEILPVDSEHNALLQALGAGSTADVVRMILTASGGPFRAWTAERIARATPEDTAAHPTYAMGAKINVDSASLMNKGLELIEARHLFDLRPDQLDVVVHPQSIIHGLVEWRDGAVTAGMALPDMHVPIAHCLGAPERIASTAGRLDLAAIGALTFEPPDEARFPCLGLAKEALAAGGGSPTILNAANEVAVAAFLGREVAFPEIPRIVAEALEAWSARMPGAPGTVDEALILDREVRDWTRARMGRSAGGRETTRRAGWSS